MEVIDFQPKVTNDANARATVRQNANERISVCESHPSFVELKKAVTLYEQSKFENAVKKFDALKDIDDFQVPVYLYLALLSEAGYEVAGVEKGAKGYFRYADGLMEQEEQECDEPLCNEQETRVKLSSSEEVSESSLKGNEPSLSAQLENAITLYKELKYDEALAAFNELKKIKECQSCANFYLQLLFLNGQKVEGVNPEEANKLLEAIKTNETELLAKAEKYGINEFDSAFAILEELANKVPPSSKAFVRLGDLLEKAHDCGVINERQKEKVKEYYQKAADLGDKEGHQKLGALVAKEKQYDLAERHYQEAGAYEELGLIYYSGKGASKDYANALKYFKLAASEGSAKAFNMLGNMYFEGNGVEKNVRIAEQCKMKSFAIPKGYDYSRGRSLFHRYCSLFSETWRSWRGDDGRSFDKKDDAVAIWWYGILDNCSTYHANRDARPHVDKILKDQSQQFDNPHLEKKFGRYYDLVVYHRVQTNDDDSLLMKALGLGSVNLEASSDSYWPLKPKPGDEEVEKPSQEEIGDAYCNLGKMYLAGEYVQKDESKANWYFGEAAKLGNAEAKKAQQSSMI